MLPEEGDRRMTHDKKVLLIGLEPKFVDYASLPVRLDEPTLRAGLEADVGRLRGLGYHTDWLLVDRGETAEAVVSAALGSSTYDCVLIGAGIRTIPPLFLPFREARQHRPRKGAARQDLLQHAPGRHHGVRAAVGV